MNLSSLALKPRNSLNKSPQQGFFEWILKDKRKGNE